MIKYFTPAVLIITLILNIIKEIKEPYGGFPRWTLFVGGWGVLIAFLILGYYLYRKSGSGIGEEV
jgi:NSS family neurotransmitter:Na+ symporter